MKLLAKLGKSLFFIVVITTLIGIVYYNRANYERAYENIRLAVGLDKPCSKPIIYSIGTLDTKFGQSRAQFENNMRQAVDIWNLSVGKELFKYSEPKDCVSSDCLGPSSDLTVNLIFDSRQQNTQVMNNLGSSIESGKTSYDSLKAEYTSLQASYNQQKSALDSLTTSYQADKVAYEKEVEYWNSRGGAQKQEYVILQSKRSSLNSQVNSINSMSQKLNTTVSELNSVASSLNALGKNINQTVGTYNKVSVANGPEFQEGEYVSDEKGERINIYQYKDQTKLIRVLAHEFGHALGIDHVADPKAIMYAYNMDSSIKLTQDDISALKTVCGIK